MEPANNGDFLGNAHPKLSRDIARVLHVPLAKAQVGRFSDGEISVEILENIRGRETFIVQPTCPPTSENLMELLVMVDACRSAPRHRGSPLSFPISASPARIVGRARHAYRSRPNSWPK